MKDSRRIQTVWPKNQKELDFKTLIKVSVIFHVAVIALIVSAVNWKSEPEIIEIPPIMELVSASPPKRVSPRPRPKPQEKLDTEPKPKPKPQHEPKPRPDPKPKDEPKSEPEPDPQEEPQDEWDTDFESEKKEPVVQKVVAPKVDNRLRMFENTVRAKIMRNFNPPKGLGVPYGTEFLVQISCLRNGGVAVDIRLHTSSGANALDKYGLRAIKLAILPKIPPNYPEDKVKLHVKFVYNE